MQNHVSGFLIHPLVLPKDDGKKKKKNTQPFCFPPSVPPHPFIPFFFLCLISLGCSWLDEKNSCWSENMCVREERFESYFLCVCVLACPACSSLYPSALHWLCLVSCEGHVWPPPIHPTMSLGIRLFCTKAPETSLGVALGINLPRLCYSRGGAGG